jgi:Family of unknown function (DUF5681)
MSKGIRQAQNKQFTANDCAARVAPYKWKPGQSGNPGGRPKKKPLTDELEKMLATVSHDKAGKTYATRLVEAAVRRAIRKSDYALKEIWERTEGKVPQAVTGANGGPVQFQVAVLYRSVEGTDD